MKKHILGAILNWRIWWIGLVGVTLIERFGVQSNSDSRAIVLILWALLTVFTLFEALSAWYDERYIFKPSETVDTVPETHVCAGCQGTDCDEYLAHNGVFNLDDGSIRNVNT